uniref:Transcription initiation factor IIA subunit 1 n=1 Tax=Photinus pyralis TaxID=7054 RepID=A0A1Y1NB06_PHOPY
MATPLCKITVMKLYEDVIDDVIKGVQELFLEDGVDEHVLQELKQTWKNKLVATKAVHNKSTDAKDALVRQADPVLPQFVKHEGKPLVQNNNNQVPQVVSNTLVPIQITLPAQPGCNTGQQITIQVPVSSLQGNQLQKVLTGPLIAATMSLPPHIATSVLQQHVTAGLKSLEQCNTIPNPVLQTDGASDEGTSRLQLDGHDDTSDDEVSDESVDLDDDKDEDEEDIADGGGGEDDPLNSDDDISEEDPTEVVDTDNVIVCQFDKITRARNKWKFHLKDGIMNINGEDYVFQKATGDAEW